MADEVKEDVPETFGETLEVVIQGLASHFGRLPTDNEVYRFVWGTAETRQWIYINKGLPEEQR